MTALLTAATQDAAAAQAEQHASEADPPAAALHGTLAAGLVLAVAPSTGRFRPAHGTTVAGGALLGHVTGGRGRADAVIAPERGEVAGLLARPGQLVRRGQPLVWLRRSAEAAA
jgi:biotin carboxyl carrier protein